MQNPNPAAPASSTEAPATPYRSSLVLLTTLFFMWGLMTSLNDILIPHLRNAFSLNYTQAMLVQFCFFGAYFLVSLPAGKLLEKIGYKNGIVTGLMVAGIGCLLFYPAANLLSYPVFLGALFVLAAGITVLQVSANPYVAALGDPATASSRLTMTQAFNSLGTTVGPYLGGLLILGVVSVELDPGLANIAPVEQAKSVQLPYMMLGLLFFAAAAVFIRIVLPKLHIEKSADQPTQGGSAWAFPHLVLGAIGIFVYVGAEVSIGSFLINFLGQPAIANMTEVEASRYVSYFWGGAMVGRFIGAVVMQRIRPGRLLAFNAVVAVLLLFTAITFDGRLAMWALIFTGLFNSIMFPTIFSLAVGGLKQHTSQGSGILCVFIVGGAIVPVLQGMIADATSVQVSFWLPLLCYVYILFYGIKGSKIGGYNP